MLSRRAGVERESVYTSGGEGEGSGAMTGVRGRSNQVWEAPTSDRCSSEHGALCGGPPEMVERTEGRGCVQGVGGGRDGVR